MKLIDQILGKKNNIRVLRYLIKHKDWEFNITELSKDLGMNKGILSRLIKKLGEDNLIKINRKGKIVLFKINKENLIIKKLIIPLFRLEENLFDLYIKPKILGVKSREIVSIMLYGSYARGEFTLTSDIDLMIIVKRKNNGIIKKFEKLKRNFLDEDMLLNVDIISSREFRNLYKMKEPLIMQMRKDCKILIGKKFDEIIK